jgi:cell division protein FtsL
MGKKSAKKQFKKFLKGNRVLLAALAGTATGITISNILGTEKAKQLVDAIEDSVHKLASKVTKGEVKNSYKETHKEAKPGPEQSKPKST